MAEESDIPVEALPDDAVRDERGPSRLCAATRESRSRHDLIRFVAGPDGTIVPDLQARLPGRGVWLTCSKAVVAAAVRSKAFSRSLKRNAIADADLPARVEDLMLRRVLDSLSLAKKAGLVTAGFAKIEAGIGADQFVALLHASDGSDEGIQKLDRRFLAACRDAGRQPAITKVLTIEQLSLALGRSNVVHAALVSGGATSRFLSEIERLERYRGTGTSVTNAGQDVARHENLGWDQGKRDV